MTTPDVSALSPTASRLSAVASIVAPLLLLASTLAFVLAGDGINDGSAGGALTVWAFFAFIVAMVGIYRVIELDAPRAAPIWLAICLIGGTASALFGLDAIFAQEIGREVVDELEDPWLLGALLPWGWFMPLGFVATGVLIWRTGAFARHSAVLLIAGGVLVIVGRPARIEPVAVLTDCLLVLAFVPMGLSMLAAVRERSGSDRPVARA